MNIYLTLCIIAVLAYLIGNINFARIFSWAFAKKDITTVGSKNPGTMNMLRTRGFGEAFLTLIMEAVKSGLPSLICFYVIEYFYAGFGELAYFVCGFFAVLGHCFPVFYKFKGGKGVACTFGIFTFHPQFWWISLIVFVICFLLMLFFVKYAFLVSFTYIFTMAITTTCLLALSQSSNFISIIVIIWLNVVLVVALHHKNIKRLCTGQEGKVDLWSKICKKKSKEEAKEDFDIKETNNEEVKEEKSTN